MLFRSINKEQSKFLPDKLFSLHIGAADRRSFVEKNFSNKPKILLSHYNSVQDIKEYCENNKYEYIKVGVNYYEKE